MRSDLVSFRFLILATSAWILTTAALNVLSSANAFASEGRASGHTNETSTLTGTESGPSIILSQNPIYQERVVAQATPLNQTHSHLQLSGNGTIILPNSTEMFNTTSTGSAAVSMFGVASGSETLMLLDDVNENATLSFREIVRFDTIDGKSRGVIIAKMETESSSSLSQLDGLFLVGQGEFQSDGTSVVALWEWKQN